MKQFTEIVVARKPQLVNGVMKNIITTNTGKTLFVDSDKDSNEPVITYKLHEVGDTFVATRNSSRKDAQGNPLYLKDETVTRQAESLEVVGFTSLEVYKVLRTA